MPRHKITQKHLDLIANYLANHAERDLLSPETIAQYREDHKNRLKWGKKGWSVNNPLHQNNPFCNICDEELQPLDDVYFFWVRALVIYHIDCFNNTSERKQLNVIYQDRAMRKRYSPKKILTELEKAEQALRKSGYEGKIG